MEFVIEVSKADMKFNCAHFIAYRGFRERLHGHNYTMSIKVIGSETLSKEGYLIDFGDLKRAARTLCKSLNEYFICPMNSDVIQIVESDTQLCLTCEDGAVFSFPRSDCMKLPLVHSSAEEISHYVWCRLIRQLGLENLVSKGVKLMEVTIAEAPHQAASFRCLLPSTEEELIKIELTKVKPGRCFEADA